MTLVEVRSGWPAGAIVCIGCSGIERPLFVRTICSQSFYSHFLNTSTTVRIVHPRVVPDT